MTVEHIRAHAGMDIGDTQIGMHPMEIKRSANPGSELIRAFRILDKSSVPRGMGAILCMRSELSAVDRDNLFIPIWMI